MNEHAETFGMTLHYGNSGGAASTALAGIKAFRSLPTLTADEFETTRVDQAEPIKEFAPGLGDPGTLGVTLGFKKTQIATLYTLFRQMKSWKITFSDGSTETFEGWIKMIGKEAPNGDETVVPVDIRVTGPATFAAAT